MKILNKVDDKKKPLGSVKDKKHKEKSKLRKKLLKVLKLKESYSSGVESEEDECFASAYKHVDAENAGVKRSDQNFSTDECIKKPCKKAKKLVKKKETLQQESEMVNVISGILSSKQKSSFNKITDVTTIPKTKPDVCKDNNVENTKIVCKQVEHIKKIPGCLLLQFMEKSALARSKKKVRQNVDYKKSVMEVFGSPTLKSAVVKTVAFNLDFAESNNCTDNTATAEHVPEDEEDVELDEITEEQPEPINSELDHLGISLPSSPTKQIKYKIYTFLNCCVLTMRSNTHLYICGALRATLIHGKVEILGHNMDSLPRDVYSPPTSSLLSFYSQTHSDKWVNHVKLQQYFLTNAQWDEIVGNLEESDSVLILEPISSTMCKFVTQHFSKFSVFTKESIDGFVDVDAYKLLQCHFFTETRRGVIKTNLLCPSICSKINHATATNPSTNVTMICGGKNSGKSTLLRYLINRCVKESPILVLDFDPGQPEFTPSGLVSATVVKEPILGPNFTHLTKPERSLALGFINVAENESKYLSCVLDLCRYCSLHGEYSHMPWIVNTCGFTGPIGYKLLVYIMNITKPRIVVELKTSVKRNNFDDSLAPDNINQYQEGLELRIDENVLDKVLHSYDHYTLDPYTYMWSSSKSSLCRNVEPREERILNFLAYFSEMSTDGISILDRVPYTISMNDIKLSFNQVCVETQYLYSVINGKIVALCHDDGLDGSRKSVVDADLLPCYGYGIVRGIDQVEKKIFIISPLSPAHIAFVNTLVYAESLPDCSFLSVRSLPNETFVPYMLSSHSHASKQLLKAPKRKFNPFRLYEIKNN